MSRNEIINKLNEILRDIFDNQNIEVNEKTIADDIEDWDSLAQVRIVVACEAQFRTKFDLNDIAIFNNIGNIADLIERKLR